MNKPPEQDPAHPAFWDTRYQAGITPWDVGGVPPRLTEHLAQHSEGEGRRIQIPGCGSAYEVDAFLAAGYHPDAVDISPVAVERARRQLGAAGDRVRVGDFFAEDGEGDVVDAIYERAFLCALPRRLWPQYGIAVHRKLRPGAELFGFFYLDEERGGPPFAIARPRLDALLAGFACLECVGVDDAPAFAGCSFWMRWRRLA